MRILLVGEYSGFHNALKHGLQQLGHEVTIAGGGDGFKQFPVDIMLGGSRPRGRFQRKLRSLRERFTGQRKWDKEVLSRFRESENQLQNFDIVQFINSNSLACSPRVEREIMEDLIAKNGKVFLAACGDDTPYTDYLVNKHQGYSILQHPKASNIPKHHFQFTHKYLIPEYRENFDFLADVAEAIIPCVADFEMALTDHPKAVPGIPLPVIVPDVESRTSSSTPTILLGINRMNYYKKGIPYFEEALRALQEQSAIQVNVKIVEDLPIAEYRKLYSKTDILLDQVLTYGQGYNALDAMARGKVVFCGNPKVSSIPKHEDVPIINAEPNVADLTQKLLQVCNDPDQMQSVGKQARQYVQQYHDSLVVARQYDKLYSL